LINGDKGMAKNHGNRVLVAFYGDDFTGTMSTAEIFNEEGVPTLVFTYPPDISFLNKHFPKVKAVGIAGTVRTMPVKLLQNTLIPVFKIMKGYKARAYLYKVCSTFDSSPEVGNIGRAIELGIETFSPDFVSMLPAAPGFGRYVVFGNMFAALGKEKIYRLDRHPSMLSHPVTPMHEADLTIHLSKQTNLPIGLVNILDIKQGPARIEKRIEEVVAENKPIIFFDCLHKEDHANICEAVFHKQPETAFFIGSHEAASGLSAVLKASNLVKRKTHLGVKPEAGHRTQVLVLSGSCATITGRQIAWSLKNGFTGTAVHTEDILVKEKRVGERERIIPAVLKELAKGKSVIIHTAIGPEDKRISAVTEKASSLGISKGDMTGSIGDFLGEIAAGLIKKSGIRRIIIAGGDTSGKIQKHLNVEALQIAVSFIDPAPLCYVYSRTKEFNGLEILFKGGQVGSLDYFEQISKAEIQPFSRIALGIL